MHDVDDEVLAHIWPTQHENVHFYGTHSVDIDSELAQLDTDRYRPLPLTDATGATPLTTLWVVSLGPYPGPGDALPL
ncbi:hypothetical protein PSN13_05199 [Micromonospora saelicesensis]|uniref:Uncharacterized protein n=1 Tax=Micromonospora saelicesensis TaxID=285676 RepID=A0A328NHN2_9ACTN|nr:hypothetical protein [Micromonospora saelicesensis]RAO30000.1 hypothetical protein PSN13_05199 [Micromonospora saelicesensis]